MSHLGPRPQANAGSVQRGQGVLRHALRRLISRKNAAHLIARVLRRACGSCPAPSLWLAPNSVRSRARQNRKGALPSGVLEEIFSQPVPRTLAPRVHLVHARRVLIVSSCVALFMVVATVGMLAATGLLEKHLLEHHILMLAFFVLLWAVMPVWHLSNYRRARRLVTWGTVVPATFSLGLPTRMYRMPPVRATFDLNGTTRSFEFMTFGHPLLDDAVVLTFESDAGLYIPGYGLVAARAR